MGVAHGGRGHVGRDVDVEPDGDESQGQASLGVVPNVSSRVPSLAHPVSPYTLDLDGLRRLLPNLVAGVRHVGAVVSSQAPEARRPAARVVVIVVVVFVAILGVVVFGSASLRGPRGGGGGGARRRGGEEGVVVGSQARRIRRPEGLG